MLCMVFIAHSECTMVREEQVEFAWCFRLRYHLQDDLHVINRSLLAGHTNDVVRRYQ